MSATAAAQDRDDAVAPGAARRFARYVGVDLGGGKGKTTAVALLRPPPHPGAPLVIERLEPRRGVEPLFDDNLLPWLRELGPEALLAVDAPLTLPACLRCQVPVCPGLAACVDPSVAVMRALTGDGSAQARRSKPAFTPYTQRATEVYLHHRHGLVPRETLGQGMGPLTARAQHLVRALGDTHRVGENLIEVYPRATLRWLPQLSRLRAERATELSRRYKKHVDERETRVRILDELSAYVEFSPGIWREECVRSDHHFDAVICALTGYLWAAEAWQLPPEVRELPHADGWIWTPPGPTPAARDDHTGLRAPGSERTGAARRSGIPP